MRDNRARPAHRRMLDTKCMNVHSTSQCSSTKNGGSMQVSNRAANALCDTRVAPGGSSASAACSKCSMLHPCSSPGVVWQRSVQQMQYATPVQLPGGRLPAQRAANAVCYTRAAPGGSSGNAACSKCSMLHPCSSRGSSSSAACSKCSMRHPCSSRGVVWQRSVQHRCLLEHLEAQHAALMPSRTPEQERGAGAEQSCNARQSTCRTYRSALHKLAAHPCTCEQTV